MIDSETFKQAWPHVAPKVRDRWPDLTDDDLRDVDGKIDRLVQKVNDYYGLSNSEVLEELTTLLQPARRGGEDVPAGEPRLGEPPSGEPPPGRRR